MNDDVTPHDRAAQLQLDACLHELAGAVPDAALPGRILAALAIAQPAAQRARHAQWLLAAALVLGSGVVAAVAWMRHDDHQRAVATVPQDPQPAPTPAPAPKPAPKPAPDPAPKADAKQDPEAKPAPDASKQTTRVDDAFHLGTDDEQRFRDDRLLETLDTYAGRGGAKGLIVKGIDEKLGASLGITRGDVLLEINGRKVESKAQARALVEEDYKRGVRSFQTRWLSNGEVVDRTYHARGQDAPKPDAKQDPNAQPAAPANKEKQPYTLIADYSDNRVIEVDEKGRVIWDLEEQFGAWDAELLANGNILITLFSISSVREVDRKGRIVWEYDELKNPYKARRLANGNTLIADTFGSRVIEVDKAGKIVWTFDKDVRPFSVERLPGGNTLITDVLKDRVIEVNPAGEIVWELQGMPNAHDAERLPDGNTLVTLRNKGKVVEVDKNGKVVWELADLSSPSDADRLPNGNTLVAENTRVREFDKTGKVVWKKEMTWAVEANRYMR